MSLTPVFPQIKIDGVRSALLMPYKRACVLLAEGIVAPGDANELKAPALGAGGERIDCWDAAFATFGLRWAIEGTRSATDPFLAAIGGEQYVPASLPLGAGAEVKLEPGAPLVAWAEWELFNVTGDRERLEHAFTLLAADFAWREANLRRTGGLYGGSPQAYQLGATARFSLGGRVVPSLASSASWVDATGMHALNARVLSEIAQVLERREEGARFDWSMREIGARMNAQMWREDDGWYYDLDEHGSHLPMRTLASYWTVLSGVAPKQRADQQLSALLDLSRFERAHSFATVAAVENDYRRRDGTPVGVVRPDFNLLCYEALHALGRWTDADKMAELHLRRVARVLEDSGELYLSYDPDRDSMAPLHDGSSGADSLLAAALCIQNTLGYLMGLRPRAVRKELELNIHLEERHSIEGVPVPGGVVDLQIAEKDSAGARRTVEVMSNAEFKLRVRCEGRSHVHEISPGSHTVHA